MIRFSLSLLNSVRAHLATRFLSLFGVKKSLKNWQVNCFCQIYTSNSRMRLVVLISPLNFQSLVFELEKGITMNAHKSLAVLATLSLLGLNVACSDKYQDGFNKGKQEGYSEGYDDGYADGDADGFARAQEYFASADYNSGFADGKSQGISIGYSQGYSAGQTSGYNSGYSSGYSAGESAGYNSGVSTGYNTGYNDGYDDGYYDGQGSSTYTSGYNAGYDAGYDDGSYDGYDIGYDDGFGDGYDVGYDDGYWGLSVGPSKKLRGYSNLLSMAHNDLIDYSKIEMPKSTKKGLVANGRLLFSESSITNKDTLKRAAVAEQFVVGQMAGQVKVKFGLSAERSLKIAKAANHFRKFAAKRALTAEDTNAYAEEIMGVNFKAIEKAYANSLKGDASEFQSVLEKAAEKNETSSEKMTEIVTKLFI